MDKTVCDCVTVAGLEVLVLLATTSVIIDIEVCVENVVSELINRVDMEKSAGYYYDGSSRL